MTEPMYDLPRPAAQLLFLRAVWDLPVLPDLPPCDPTPGPGGSRCPEDRVLAEQLWLREWSAALEQDAVPLSEQGLFFEGRDAGPVDHRQWSVWFDRVTARYASFYGGNTRRAEWRIERACRRAQRRGLRRVLVLPVSGEYTSYGPGGTVLVSIQVFTQARLLVTTLNSFCD